jgi:hypothetical protein
LTKDCCKIIYISRLSTSMNRTDRYKLYFLFLIIIIKICSFLIWLYYWVKLYIYCLKIWSDMIFRILFDKCLVFIVFIHRKRSFIRFIDNLPKIRLWWKFRALPYDVLSKWIIFVHCLLIDEWFVVIFIAYLVVFFDFIMGSSCLAYIFYHAHYQFLVLIFWNFLIIVKTCVLL